MDERIDENVLEWFENMEKMGNCMDGERVYKEECVGFRQVGPLQKRCVDSVKECLKKRGVDVRQAKRTIQWRRFVRGNASSLV